MASRLGGPAESQSLQVPEGEVDCERAVVDGRRGLEDLFAGVVEAVAVGIGLGAVG